MGHKRQMPTIDDLYDNCDLYDLFNLTEFKL